MHTALSVLGIIECLAGIALCIVLIRKTNEVARRLKRDFDELDSER